MGPYDVLDCVCFMSYTAHQHTLGHIGPSTLTLWQSAQNAVQQASEVSMENKPMLRNSVGI